MTNHANVFLYVPHTLYRADDDHSFYRNISASFELANLETNRNQVLYSLNKTLCLFQVLFYSRLCRYLRSTTVAFLSFFHKAVSAGWRCYDAAYIWDVG